MKKHEKQKNLWLMEMMEAALEDSPDMPGSQKVETKIRKASFEKIEAKQFKTRPPWLIPVAAAVLAASVTLPIGIIAGRRIAEKNTGKRVDDAFIEELIGGSLFDEGLPESEEWFSDINIEVSYFDI